MNEQIIQLLKQLLEKTTVINFAARWRMQLYFAVDIGGGVYGYRLDKKCVPVQEIYKVDGSYGYDLSDELAAKVLHGSKMVNLVQAYNGINVDLADVAIAADQYTKRFFNTDEEIAAGVTEKSDVQAGDCLAVLVLQ